MSEDEIIKIVKDFIRYIRFDEKPKYGVRQQYMAIENLLDLYQQEREKNKELEEELSKYISGEYFTEKQAKHLEITRKMFWINKDKIRDMKRYREFELQQEYKEFKEDIEWKTYNKILEEN